jgi:hypothetical protein
MKSVLLRDWEDTSVTIELTDMELFLVSNNRHYNVCDAFAAHQSILLLLDYGMMIHKDSSTLILLSAFWKILIIYD